MASVRHLTASSVGRVRMDLGEKTADTVREVLMPGFDLAAAFNSFLASLEWQGLFRVLVAGIVGVLVGYEREREHKPAGMRTYGGVAMGGGGFSMEPDNPLLDDYILSLARVPRPKVCFVPTASGGHG